MAAAAATRTTPEETVIASEGARGLGHYPDYDSAELHFRDWLDAIRDNRLPADHAEAAIAPAAVALYGNLAYKENRVVEIG